MTPDNSYADFEDTFRGDSREVQERLAKYLSIIQECRLTANQSSSWPLLLDIGCGRGEWLDLLRRNGFSAKGIDSDKEMVSRCRSMGLVAEWTDARTFLDQCLDGAYSAISIFHVVEHISQQEWKHIAAQCLRILRPGGALIVETPNIDNVMVGLKGFYADPTHIRRIHPEVTAYELRATGFEWAEVFYVNGEPILGYEQQMSLREVLAGTAKDTAVIAAKSGSSEEGLSQFGAWQKALRGDWTTEGAAQEYDRRLSVDLMKKQESLESLYTWVAAQSDALQEVRAKQGEIVDDIGAIHGTIHAILNSRSWKVTAPLRKAESLARRGRSRWRRIRQTSRQQLIRPASHLLRNSLRKLPFQSLLHRLARRSPAIQRLWKRLGRLSEEPGHPDHSRTKALTSSPDMPVGLSSRGATVLQKLHDGGQDKRPRR